MQRTAAGDRSLASLFDIEGLTGTPDVWIAEDLAHVLRHQMDSPLDPEESRPTAEGGGRTFGDLFDDPAPALHQLHQSKRAAKAFTREAGGVVPSEVGIVLYYLSILLARMRHGERITELDDRALAVGVRTVLSREWLDVRSRRILDDGLRLIESPT